MTVREAFTQEQIDQSEKDDTCVACKVTNAGNHLTLICYKDGTDCMICSTCLPKYDDTDPEIAMVVEQG